MSDRDRIDRAHSYVRGLMDPAERERAERDMEVDAEFRDALKHDGFGTPEEYRKKAVEAAIRDESQRRAIDSLKAKGMTVNVPGPAEIERFRALAEPIYRSYETAIGADLIRRFRAAAQEDSLS